MFKYKSTAVIFLCLMVIGLSASNGKKTLYVNDHKVSCAGKVQCIEVKEKAKAEWAELSDTIQGFNYQEGYKYTLEVEVAEAKDPYAGRITDKYRLVKIVSKTKTNYQPAEQLQGRKCMLQTMYDTKRTLSFKDDSIFIRFDTREGKITGHGICNSFNGIAKFDGSAVKISGIMSTRVFCKGNELEGVITKFLSNAISWSLEDDGMLTLLCTDGSKLTFQLQQAN